MHRTELHHLLPEQVAVAEIRAGDALEPLFPDEARLVANAVEKRRWEFQAGRTCARAAMQQLGEPPRPILARDRAPIWPDGLIGSICHCDGYAAAAVARTRDIVALGLDVEAQARLEKPLWRFVCTESEIAALSRATEPALVVALLFSAKEAFFKFQYPITGMFLDFHDVDVELDLERGSFQVRALRDGPRLLAGRRYTGNFALGLDHVLCGMAAARWP